MIHIDIIFLGIMTGIILATLVFFFYSLLAYERWRHKKFLSEQVAYFQKLKSKKEKDAQREELIEERREEFAKGLGRSIDTMMETTPND